MNTNRFRHYLALSGRIFLLMLLTVVWFTALPTTRAEQSFQLSVNDRLSESVNGFSYYRAELSTSDGLPAKQDVRIWCMNRGDQQWEGQRTDTALVLLELKKGETNSIHEVYIPSSFSSTALFSLSSNIQNRGRHLLETSRNAPNQKEPSRILVVGDSPASETVTFKPNGPVAKKILASNADQRFDYTVNPSKRRAANFWGEIALRPCDVQGLPQKWIGYTSLNHVFVDQSNLKKIAAEPKKFEALKQWIVMGGSLIVFDCGEKFERVRDVTRLFKINENRGVPEVETLAFTRQSDQPTLQQSLSVGLRNNWNSSNISPAAPSTADINRYWKSIKGKVVGNQFLLATESDFVLNRLVNGRILYHPKSLARSKPTDQVNAEFATNTAAWQQSHPIGTSNINGEAYNQWNLRNVGLPPTGFFAVILFGFMTVIGPAGYFFLKYKRRLHYQIWMVPSLSLIACCSLLFYALLLEGFGTKIRNITFIELDQDLKTAAVFTRNSIYSSLQPDAYQFDGNQFAVLENEQYVSSSLCRWLDSDRYQLTGSRAAARSVHQVFVAAPQAIEAGITVVQSDAVASNVELTNRFKSPAAVIIAHIDGKIHYALDVQPGVTATGTGVETSELSQVAEVRDFLRDALPPNKLNYYVANWRYSYLNQQEIGGTWDHGVLRIGSFSEAVKVEKYLAPGRYIAVFDSLPEVRLVVPGANEVDGKVFVHGKW